MDIRALVERLRDPSCFPHPVERFEIVETHLSLVLLTGPYAYKFKKPVSLGFVDFRRAEDRLRFCEEELRVNRRLAPELYLEVVPITAGPRGPRVGEDGEVLEHAVRMRQFRGAARLDRVLAAGALRAKHLERFADDLAAFHRRGPPAPATAPWGDPARLREQLADCLDALEGAGCPVGETRRVCEAVWQRLCGLLAARRARSGA